MIIGLDFDGTITGDVDCMLKLIKLFEEFNHKVVVVTNREENYPNLHYIQDILGLENNHIKVIMTNGIPKREACRNNEIEVDIWIDDNPILVDFGLQGYDELHKKDPSAIKG